MVNRKFRLALGRSTQEVKENDEPPISALTFVCVRSDLPALLGRTPAAPAADVCARRSRSLNRRTRQDSRDVISVCGFLEDEERVMVLRGWVWRG